MPAEDVLGYVLAGGESSRMRDGGAPLDKALLLLEGRTLLERALATVAEVCPDPRILCGPAARCERLRQYGPTLADRTALSGPVGGLQAALCDVHARGHQWVLLMPVDLPWMTSAVLHAFVCDALQSGASAACMRDAISPQPLPCIVHTAAMAQIDAALHADQRKLLPLLRSVGAQQGRRSGLCILPVDESGGTMAHASRLFWNINTPEDYRSAKSSETLGSSAHQSKHGG